MWEMEQLKTEKRSQSSGGIWSERQMKRRMTLPWQTTSSYSCFAVPFLSLLTASSSLSPLTSRLTSDGESHSVEQSAERCLDPRLVLPRVSRRPHLLRHRDRFGWESFVQECIWWKKRNVREESRNDLSSLLGACHVALPNQLERVVLRQVLCQSLTSFDCLLPPQRG
eukprot:CAMPEP_0177720706 /NCGR_PEP_ID=MMETSP0484_2-20121128/16759_1 /TAXON_ID=354590 /ORGANISM="Rhodomonas lens, Strain RHODO" /LENGTH=167 /DNA_ID=CAMNT_0019232967 /DNA_START=335 /DNA_END=838 /DNA_ORIENTATION=+